MSRRYQVLLEDQLIGTVHLVGPTLRVERARLGAMPAFKRLARLRRRVDEASVRYEEHALATPESVLADEEAALRELSDLALTLVDDSGAAGPRVTVRLVNTSPPTLRIAW